MCIKNKKKFLWIKYNGPCDEAPIRIGKFMPIANSNYFVVKYKCSLCGKESVNHFVEWKTLLKQGVSNDDLLILQNSQY